MSVDNDQYNSREARSARAASLRVKKMAQDFGDPNMGDHRDPYMNLEETVAEALAMRTVMSQGREYVVGDGKVTPDSVASVAGQLQSRVEQGIAEAQEAQA